jgi:hypothetical protein
MDEVLAAERRHRRLDVDVQARSGVDELFDVCPPPVRKGAQDPAVELALGLAQSVDALPSGPA